VTNGSLPKPPAIAIVDSGIDAARADFGGRVIKQVTMTSLPGNSPGDGRGHGTFVAGIAAGSASGYTGAAPSAPLVSLDVMDDQGMAVTSDVIAAADWIYQNRAAYNIRVANFSLHSTAPASVFWDPLDRAVEKLWLSGVVVVAAAGNYGVNGQPSGVLYAPGNDPFIITVGADDVSGSVSTNDDSAAPWSSYGYTIDGFAKPDLAAPGRYMVGPVPAGSTLALERPGSIVAPGYMQLSGTSFAAPVVAGAAAYLLALHPDWTPDQVKGALMLTAKPTPNAAPMSEGVGEADVARAAVVTAPPNANLALDAFVGPDPAGGPTPVFDAASWGSAAQANASWGTASWGSASWGSASWGSASWGTTFWSAASWGTASWGTASWGTSAWGSASSGTASWGSSAVADNAEGEAGPTPVLDPAQEAEAEAELGLVINADGSVGGTSTAAALIP
jgi:serine protease AprX